MEKTSKIYIAGHLGLVGSALWKNLQSKGYTNMIGRTIDELNLMDTRAVNAFFEQEKPEYVILAAAKVGGIVANNTYRGQFIYENLMIQNNVIHAAYVHQVKKLLFLGSTCIYPREAPQPMPEDCLLTGPLEYTNEPYAIAKIAGIKLCESYNLQYGTNFISVMPTNLYGPNDNFDLEKSHVLPALLRKLYLGKCLEENNWDAIREDLNKRPIEGISGEVRKEDEKVGKGESEKAILEILSKYGITLSKPDRFLKPVRFGEVSVELWGTGTPLREFLWSEEMADACIFLMENIDFQDTIRENSSSIRENSYLNEVRNTHINIGTGKEITIRDLAFLIKEKVGFGGELLFDASKPDGSMRKLTDPSKLHALGWHHKIEIDEGIEKLYSWYLNK
ncbi:MAG TPA: GDP-L-fucose synthase [Prolixibacteraceae bacterium]|jgi:GDP-L-fucose synthase